MKKKLDTYNKSEHAIAFILIEEFEKWESTTTVSLEEFKRLIRRLHNLLTNK